MTVVISGMGCISPLGAGVEAYAEALLRGRCAVELLDLFDVEGYRSGLAARVQGIPRPDRVGAALWRRANRCDRMALFALEEALGDASRPDVGEAGLCCGLSTAGMFEAEEAMDRDPRQGLAGIGPRRLLGTVVCSTSDVLVRHLGLRGPLHTTSTACSSTANAIGLGLDLIRAGEASVVLAGGADALCRLTLAGFNSLGVVTSDRPRPFDERRSGMVLGEGAAFLVLEDEQHALARGVRPRAELRGHACIAEGHHIVHPIDTGDGALRAMRGALEDAGDAPGDVDHVNAHGTATGPNDRMEARAIRALLGPRADHVPVTSNKSLLGHSLGASGALEAVACCLTLQRGFVAPTAGFSQPDPDCAVDVVHGEARPGTFDRVLSNSFAFGGNDVCLVFGSRRGAP